MQPIWELNILNFKIGINVNNMLEIALGQYGIKEIAGKKHNPLVLRYFQETGHKWVHTDETAWCTAFVNWCAMKADKVYSNKLNARSYLAIGKSIRPPELGCIAILWRVHITSWKGHVGFYITEDEKNVYLLGGNQHNKVCIKPYPRNRVLGYRKLFGTSNAGE